MALLAFGKGSGKDTISAHVILYIVYLLLCAKDPTMFYPGLNENSPLDILNVAADASQARDVFFKILKSYVSKWVWLIERMSISAGGSVLSKALPANVIHPHWKKFYCNINSDNISFGPQITAVSKHSGDEAIEGRNTIACVLDELASFEAKAGQKLFDNLISSAITRCDGNMKILVISYLRYEGDLVQKLIRHMNHMMIIPQKIMNWMMLICYI